MENVDLGYWADRVVDAVISLGIYLAGVLAFLASQGLWWLTVGRQRQAKQEADAAALAERSARRAAAEAKEAERRKLSPVGAEILAELECPSKPPLFLSGGLVQIPGKVEVNAQAGKVWVYLDEQTEWTERLSAYEMGEVVRLAGLLKAAQEERDRKALEQLAVERMRRGRLPVTRASEPVLTPGAGYVNCKPVD